MNQKRDNPDKTFTTEDILGWLKARRNETNLAGMARFGIVTENAVGISNVDMRALGRKIGRNHQRALELWDSGVREARLLACYTEEPKKVTRDQAIAWMTDMNSWEIVDQAAVLFVSAGLTFELIPVLVADDREFVRRLGFSMIAMASVHLKKVTDAELLAFLPLIEAHASDPRNFVKKAVNWALRQIGKHSFDCHSPALDLSRKLAASSDKAERWIGKDAVRELENEKILARMKACADRLKAS